MDAESELLGALGEAWDQKAEIERLKESLHEGGVRNGKLVLQLREKDLVIETMNEAHKLLIAEKDAEIARLKGCNNSLRLAAVEYRRFINECADALEEEFGESRDLMQSQQRPWNLIQRAREATR